MENLFKSRWVRTVDRYLALILIVVVAWGWSWIDYVKSAAPYYDGLIPAVAYLLVTPAWIVVSVLERRPMIWRQLLIWAPAAPIIAMLFVVGLQHPRDNWELDGKGIAFGLYAIALLFIGSLCGLGAVAAAIYRPERPRSAGV